MNPISPEHLTDPDLWWKACLAGAAIITTISTLIMGIYYWRKLTSKKDKDEPAERRIVDQPVEITMAKEFATKTELHDLETRWGREIARVDTTLGSMDKQIEANFRDLDAKRSSSINDLHKHIDSESKGSHHRIDEILKQLSELGGYIRGKIK